MGHPVVMRSFFGKTGQTFLSYFIRSSHIYTDFIDVFSISGEISFNMSLTDLARLCVCKVMMLFSCFFFRVLRVLMPDVCPLGLGIGESGLTRYLAAQEPTQGPGQEPTQGPGTNTMCGWRCSVTGQFKG